MSNRDEAIWLVKSSQRVIGPISQNEIFNRLKSRELTLNDEASSPGRRWQQVQNHPDLREMVEDIRRALISEETEVSWTPNTTNVTQTLTDFAGDELTEEISDKIGKFTRTAEIVIDELPEEKKTNATANARFQTNTLSQNPLIQKKADRTAKWLWVITLVVLIGGMFIVWQKKTNTREGRVLSIDALRAQIPAVIQTGDFPEALKELKSVFPDPLQSGEMGLYMAPLLIQVENQTVLGKRLLNQLLSNHQGEPKLELTAMGVADLIEGQVDSARQNFERALVFDKEYVPAIINLGVALFQQGRYPDAKANADLAIHLNPAEGEAQLLLAQSAVYLKSSQDTDLALRELTAYRNHQMDYEPEALFYTIYLNWLRDNKVADDKLDSFLELDPQLTQDHRHNVFIYKGHTQWSVIGRFCQQMADQMEASARTSMLKAVCFSKEGRKLEARTWIEKAVNQAPQEPLVQTWYSYILNENGLGDQASVALGRAGELNRKGEHSLPILMQARFCQIAGDYDCASQGWQRLFSANDRSISALGGLANTYAGRNNFKEATNYIDRGLRVSADYIPLLKLKLRGEKEGWYGPH